jgi:dsRNA-specific ribonuclease
MEEDIITVGEEMVFSPYNPKNKEISLNDVQTILLKYGVPCKVNHFNLYKRAFIHSSYCNRNFSDIKPNIKLSDKPPNCIDLHTKSNERLEFLGDGVLECVTKYYLYRRFPNECEGFMTEKKIALVKNEAIGKFAYEMGLHQWYIISKHAEEKNIRTNFKKLGCLFEAFIGALFLDCNKIQVHDEDEWFTSLFVTGPGFQMAQIFIESVFEKHVDWSNIIMNNDNYKNILQIKIQQEFKTTPIYIELKHDDNYHMGVYLAINQEKWNMEPHKAISFSHIGSFQKIHEYIQQHGKIFILLGEGNHKIKKKSEQLACEQAISLLN